MLDYSLTHWVTFTVAAVVVVVTPGPDLACILGQTVRGGRKAGLAALLGMCFGAAIHISLVTLGLAALVSSSDLSLAVLKWIGAAYLMYLSGCMIWSTSKGILIESETSNLELFDSFRKGIFVNLLNPKAILFYLSFLPQFIVYENGSEQFQIALHGALVIALAVLVYLPIIVLANSPAQSGRRQRGALTMLERITGFALIGLGARLALVG